MLVIRSGVDEAEITVRVLFSFVGGTGHFNPLIPIARAAEAAGHVVAVTGRPAMMPAVRAAGFTATAFATGEADTGTTPVRTELQAPDAEHEAQVVRRAFAGRLARARAPLIIDLCGVWRPDLLVCDEMDFGAIVAAERAGMPHATVIVIAAGSFVPAELVTEPVQALRSEHGLPPDPDLNMLSRYLVLSPVPPSYRDPRFPLPPTAHSLQPFGLNLDGGDLAPPWLAQIAETPTVYFTLGTVFNLESGDLLNRVVAALGEMPINLVVSVSNEIDPAELGPQPTNVRVERYIPQAVLFPHCDLVVSHGGSGTVIGALAHGLPMVLIPLGADQLVNAERCLALGVARVLDAMTITPETVREAVLSVLADAPFRQQAQRIKDEVAALPGPEYAVALLERLASEQRPILSSRAVAPATRG